MEKSTLGKICNKNQSSISTNLNIELIKSLLKYHKEHWKNTEMSYNTVIHTKMLLVIQYDNQMAKLGKTKQDIMFSVLKFTLQLNNATYAKTQNGSKARV